jgi:tetratricopeptide (TPR) repeat protein
MAVTDRYGLTVSTASAAARDRYQDGMDALLSLGPGAGDAFAGAVAADEGLALAHAGAALLAFFVGDGAAARVAIGRARELVAGATRRERQHVEALAVLMGGDATRGLALIEAHVAEFPRDALLVNQASSSIAVGGRADREAFRAGFLERLVPDYGTDWWFQSALAFTYHEVNRFEESRRLSERSLEQYPGNANATHNIAHICFETVDNDGGVAFLDDWLAGYDRQAPFYCHLAWHLAMFELHRGRYRRALEICERDILPAGNPRLAMTDGAALLWRYRLYGCHEGALPWRPLVELAARVVRPGFIFGDVHAALAYAASGDDAALAALVDALRALDAKGHPIAGTVALPLVLGVAAYASGDWAGALAHLEPVAEQMHRVGGSHAQWELWEETIVVCQLRLGRHEDAARTLRRRLARRASARDLLWLGRAQTALGEAAAAAASLADARRGWPLADPDNPEQRACRAAG